VLEQAVNDRDMRDSLVSIFNDINNNHSNALQNVIDSIPGIDKLKYKPAIHNVEVDDQIAESFEKLHLVPTFFFIDPWGFKGLSLRLVRSVLKDWGCDCIFFFNFNRINMGLTNRLVRHHMDDLFGEEKAEELKVVLQDAHGADREKKVLNSIIEALKDRGGQFVLPFCFKDDHGTRTSHYLIFVTKHFRGYEIMKSIMAKESTSCPQGVPSFMFDPHRQCNPVLFELERPLDSLKSLLRSDFAGRALTMRQIYEQHSNGRPYINENYKEALRQLEAENRISAEPPATRRRHTKGVVTFADTVKVRFP
jgi:three-Cys-motif partner protein